MTPHSQSLNPQQVDADRNRPATTRNNAIDVIKGVTIRSDAISKIKPTITAK
jgi:hypothetical protein